MKRVKWLQDFFSELERDKTFRSSEVFQVFISVDDPKRFEAMKKQINKLPMFKSKTEVRLLGGKFEVDMGIDKMRFAANVGPYVKDTQTLYNELMNSINSTTNTMLLLSDAFNKNSEIIKDLAIVHARIQVSFLLILVYRIG